KIRAPSARIRQIVAVATMPPPACVHGAGDWTGVCRRRLSSRQTMVESRCLLGSMPRSARQENSRCWPTTNRRRGHFGTNASYKIDSIHAQSVQHRANARDLMGAKEIGFSQCCQHGEKWFGRANFVPEILES